MMTFLLWAYKATLEHEAVLGLLGLAFIITMRPKLPRPFCRIDCIEWAYEWTHDALKAFVSFRSPSQPAIPAAPSQSEVTGSDGKQYPLSDSNIPG